MAVEAVIDGAELIAAHDGTAELLVALRYENGACHDVTLDEPAARALMQACQATSVEELIGRPWQLVREALQVGWNRFNPEFKLEN